MFLRNSAAGLVAVALGLSAVQARAQVHVVEHHGESSETPAPRATKPVAAAPKAKKPVARASAKPAAYRVAVKTPVRPSPVAAELVRPAPVAPRPAALPSEQEIAILFDLWNAALQTGSPELVASLYAQDAVLLPTVSNRVRTTRLQIADYFHHFLALQPRGTINQQFIRILGPDLALNAGVYTFDLVRDGRPEQVTARYDFLYKRVNGRWLIVDHHSSKMPEPMVAGPVQTAAATH
jgi:uncharacterized protein (TIGR02246 family)